MLRFALPVLLLAATACAERQDHRSSVEAACAAEAERLVLQRNRGRSIQIDNASAGPGTIMEETNVSAAFARQGEFRERERLTRECIRQTNEARPPAVSSPAAPTPAAPAPAPTPAASTPAAAPAATPATGLPARGTALPPPAPPGW